MSTDASPSTPERGGPSRPLRDAAPGRDALAIAAEWQEPRRALRLLRETCADSGWEIQALRDVEVIKHWPGRRLTLRFRVEARDALGAQGEHLLYGKQFRGRRGERCYRSLRALGAVTAAGLALPQALGYLPRRHFLLMTGLPGRPLGELCHGSEAAAACRRAGRALQRFHALGDAGAEELPVHDAAAEAAVLAQAPQRVGEGPLPAPLKQRHAATCAGVCAELTAATGAARALLHRDLYPEQILLTDSAVGFVDLDEVAGGEPELDLGNLLAHFQLAALQTGGDLEVAAAHGAAVLQGYAEQGRIDPRRQRVYQAAALLRLASLARLAEPERSRLGWTDLAAELVRAAAMLVRA